MTSGLCAPRSKLTSSPPFRPGYCVNAMPPACKAIVVLWPMEFLWRLPGTCGDIHLRVVAFLSRGGTVERCRHCRDSFRQLMKLQFQLPGKEAAGLSRRRLYRGETSASDISEEKAACSHATCQISLGYEWFLATPEQAAKRAEWLGFSGRAPVLSACCHRRGEHATNHEAGIFLNSKRGPAV